MPQLQGPRHQTEYPYAEAEPVEIPGAVGDMMYPAFRAGMSGMLPSRLGGATSRGFSRIHEMFSARADQEAMLAQERTRWLEAKLAELNERYTPSMQGSRPPGGFAKLSRPWPGVYKGSLEQGRTQPRSYRNPRTYTVEE